MMCTYISISLAAEGHIKCYWHSCANNGLLTQRIPCLFGSKHVVEKARERERAREGGEEERVKTIEESGVVRVRVGGGDSTQNPPSAVYPLPYNWSILITITTSKRACPGCYQQSPDKQHTQTLISCRRPRPVVSNGVITSQGS